MVSEAIQQSGNASGIGKNLVPFLEGSVGSDNHGTLLVAAVDDLVEKVCGVVVVGEVGQFVNAEQMGPGIAGCCRTISA